MRAEKIHTIDAVRGLAACGVAFLYHFRYLSGDQSFTHPTAAPFAWIPGMTWFYAGGDGLVDLFFVLSGFIFCYIYRPATKRAPVTGKTYAINRIARLYPLHLITLSAATLFLVASAAYGSTYGGWVVNPRELLLHLAMLKSGPVLGSFNAPAWSISVECLCYLLFFFWAKQSQTVFLGLCAATLSLGLVLQQNWVVLPLNDWWFARGLVGFFAGCLLYSARDITAKIPLVLLIGAFVIGLSLSVTNPPILHHVGHFARLSLLAWVPLIAIITRPSVQFLARNPVAKFMGDHSFSIYLWHAPIAMALLLWNQQQPYPVEHWGYVMLLHVLLTMIVAYLSFRYFERPAQRWLRSRGEPKREGSAPVMSA